MRALHAIIALALSLSIACADAPDTAYHAPAEQLVGYVQTVGPRAALEGIDAREGVPVVHYCDAEGSCWPVYWLIRNGVFTVTSIDPDETSGTVEILWLTVEH